MTHRKFNPAHHEILDRPERLGEYDIDAIARALDLGPGKILVDIGAGTGMFSMALAGMCSRVCAVDISEDMLAIIQDRSAGNVVPVLSTEEAIPLEDASADAVLMSNVLHELEGTGTLKETLRITRPGGRVVVLDWKKRREERGPPFEHRLSEDVAVRTCQDAGLKFAGEFEPGPDSIYGLMFMRP